MARRAVPARTTARRRSSPTGRSARAYLELLTRILHADGHSVARLRRDFEAACRRLPKASPTRARDRALVDLPHVLSLWHSDQEFLDTNGRPRPLPMSGTASLSSLVRRVFPRRAPRTVIAALERNGALQRVGKRFLPTGRTIQFDPSEGVPHGLEALLGLLRTIEYNLSGRGQGDRLFERIARNPRIPEELAAGFEAKARAQLLTLLVTLDAELARLELMGKPGGRTVPIGIGAYMIAEPSRLRGRS